MADIYSLVSDLLRVGINFVPVGVSLPLHLVVVADLQMHFRLQSVCGLEKIRWSIRWSSNFICFGCLLFLFIFYL